MARRRKKKGGDLISFVVYLLMIGGFLGVFHITQSVSAGVTAVVFILIGFFVIVLLLRKNQSDRLKRSGIAEIDRMDGIQFEKYLGQLFKTHGYAVEVTKAAGDYGADLVLDKAGKKIVVQAKRYSKNVGLKAVQEVIASKAVYGATEAWVITNSDFTDQAVNLAKANGVKLVNRSELIDLILHMNPHVVPASAEVSVTNRPLTHFVQKETQQETNKGSGTCNRCGKPMVLRNGKNGKFYGCSAFPKCRNTRNSTGN
jgi:restriction system protein